MFVPESLAERESIFHVLIFLIFLSSILTEKILLQVKNVSTMNEFWYTDVAAFIGELNTIFRVSQFRFRENKKEDGWEKLNIYGCAQLNWLIHRQLRSYVKLSEHVNITRIWCSNDFFCCRFILCHSCLNNFSQQTNARHLKIPFYGTENVNFRTDLKFDLFSQEKLDSTENVKAWMCVGIYMRNKYLWEKREVNS